METAGNQGKCDCSHPNMEEKVAGERRVLLPKTPQAFLAAPPLRSTRFKTATQKPLLLFLLKAGFSVWVPGTSPAVPILLRKGARTLKAFRGWGDPALSPEPPPSSELPASDNTVALALPVTCTARLFTDCFCSALDLEIQ